MPKSKFAFDDEDVKQLKVVRAEDDDDPDGEMTDEDLAAEEAFMREVEAEERADEDGPGTRQAFAGFSIIVENPKGSVREWTDADGTTGSTKMRYPYGYIEGARGSDGDSVDVYLGPSEDAAWAYVVHQQRKLEFTEYDEDKVMLGFDSANHARDAYLAQYDDERFFGGMTVLSLEDLRARIGAGDRKITHAGPGASCA